MDSKKLTEEFGNLLCQELIEKYYDRMQEFFIDNRGGLIESDVLVMVMNLVVGVSTNLFYSIKSFFPKTDTIDYEFIRATAINKLRENFDKIKEVDFSEDYVALTNEQLTEVQTKGFTEIVTDGVKRTITREDVKITKREADRVAHENEKRRNSKIIVPH